MRFRDRRAAGELLADALRAYENSDAVVLGLPRGGLIVAAAVAKALGLDLDVILVAKLGVPGQPELAAAAIGEGGVLVRNDDVIAHMGVREGDLSALEQSAREELDRRARIFRGDRPRVAVSGRPAIVVDDGIATGATALAALEVVRAWDPSQVILAVPVAPGNLDRRITGAADEVVCLHQPYDFGGVGRWYVDFRPVTTEEAAAVLPR